MQAELDGVRRVVGVALLPREALFLSGGDDLTVAQQTGRAVVVEGRYAQNPVGVHFASVSVPLGCYVRADVPRITPDRFVWAQLQEVRRLFALYSGVFAWISGPARENRADPWPESALISESFYYMAENCAMYMNYLKEWTVEQQSD